MLSGIECDHALKISFGDGRIICDIGPGYLQIGMYGTEWRNGSAIVEVWMDPRANERIVAALKADGVSCKFTPTD